MTVDGTTCFLLAPNVGRRSPNPAPHIVPTASGGGAQLGGYKPYPSARKCNLKTICHGRADQALSLGWQLV